MAGFASERVAGITPESVAGSSPEWVAGFAPESVAGFDRNTQEPIPCPKRQPPWFVALENGQLVSECQDLKLERGTCP